ncbi:hypothetical protein BE04_26575 [Sorangium cellulosum]|uniref:Uncharacterized protein n=1 Tax=Sorangium cellulosum TaxID=56 RepID=A0A150P462_SORCE|nr:hypothetical protein BE04_26575 [Sorangium cellulosum]
MAFVLTQAIEVPIYRRALGLRPLVMFGASLITHPIVCFVMPALWRTLYVAAIRGDPRFVLGETGYFLGYGVLAEGFAVAVEAAYFWKAGGDGAAVAPLFDRRYIERHGGFTGVTRARQPAAHEEHLSMPDRAGHGEARRGARVRAWLKHAKARATQADAADPPAGDGRSC